MPKPNQPPKAAADVVHLAQWTFPTQQPERLSEADALRIVRVLAADTTKIVVIQHGKQRAKKRQITRRQIELCVQKGTIDEGPFLNKYGNWQMNLHRHAAGEQITCTVAIEWIECVIVITAF